MIDPRLLELINAEIDGENAPEASAELRELLARNPEAREHWRGLEKLAKTLERVPGVDPPHGLRDAVLGSVGATHVVPAPAPIAHRRKVPSIRFGFAFAAGLTLGLVGYHVMIGGSAIDPATVSGSMVAVAPAGTIETPIETDGVRGAAEISVVDGGVEIRIDLDPADAVRAELSFDAESFGLEALKHGNFNDFEVTSGRVSWTQSAAAEVMVRLNAHAAQAGPFRLDVFRDGVSIHSEILRTNFPARRL